jgi:hypothetical protein
MRADPALGVALAGDGDEGQLAVGDWHEHAKD